MSAQEYCSICDTVLELLSAQAESLGVSKKWGVGAGCASRGMCSEPCASSGVLCLTCARTAPV